ncbi:hypothetical protein BJY04DRAFT_107331 [Aspergillus karnatakaensis]|uniref:uncharacterized protein n=1 Tax=Aspergillus karnatakaensis TaxID=1810916 RepID=UPI003CCDB4B2
MRLSIYAIALTTYLSLTLAAPAPADGEVEGNNLVKRQCVGPSSPLSLFLPPSLQPNSPTYLPKPRLRPLLLQTSRRLQFPELRSVTVPVQ